MSTYWHVAHESYRDGMPLFSRDRQNDHGIETPWKWDDADEDTDSGVICLFPDTEDGRREADWLWYENPAYVLLRVEIDEDYDNVVFVEEGYPAIVGQIDACDITVVRRGYLDGVISEAGVYALCPVGIRRCCWAGGVGAGEAERRGGFGCCG